MISKGIAYIAEHFGLEPQLRQLQEECSELNVAASKFIRKRGPYNYMVNDSFAEIYDNLTEELADVLLVAYQVIDLLDAEQRVLGIMAGKIERTTLKILEENNEIDIESDNINSSNV